LSGDLRAERYLRLKLGHHEVVVDGISTDKKIVKGRSDVVVFQNEVPLLLAELKAPNGSASTGNEWGSCLDATCPYL
jgi:hypothetical protein